MLPLVLERKVTPNSTPVSGPESTTAGTAVAGQIVVGAPCRGAVKRIAAAETSKAAVTRPLTFFMKHTPLDGYDGGLSGRQKAVGRSSRWQKELAEWLAVNRRGARLTDDRRCLLLALRGLTVLRFRISEKASVRQI